MDSTSLNTQCKTHNLDQNTISEQLLIEVKETKVISKDYKSEKRQLKNDTVSDQIDAGFGEPSADSTLSKHHMHYVKQISEQLPNEIPIISMNHQLEKQKNGLTGQIDDDSRKTPNSTELLYQQYHLKTEESKYQSRNYKSKTVQRNLKNLNCPTYSADDYSNSIEYVNYDNINSNLKAPYSGNKDDEIIVKCDNKAMANQFVLPSQLVWLHANEVKHGSFQCITYLNAFEQIMKTMNTFTSWDQTFDHIKRAQSFCFVVISVTDWQNYVQEIEKLPMVAHVIVDLTLIPQETPKKKALNKIDYVINDGIQGLTKTIEKVYEDWKISGVSTKLDLPAFIPLSREIHSSDIYYNHWALEILTKFTNRDQAKQDFVDLAKTITKDSLVEEFSQNYNQYNLRDIFNWYTRESFLYKLTNNCLRLSTPDSIQYCRLIVKDLQEAIKEQYTSKSKHFSGLLYRGAYISDDEWNILQNNIGGDIEMHGFLSTSKHRSVAEEFALSDPDRKALITIVVPPISNPEDVSGFAELKEFSEFEGEEEFLFNIMSRFTVESVSIEEVNNKRFRHLVLVYGAHSLRLNMRDLSLKLEVQVENKNALCYLCNYTISSMQARDAKNRMVIDLVDQDRYFCLSCVDKIPSEDKNPLVIVDVNQFNEAKASIDGKLKIAAQVIQYKEQLKFNFYGQRYFCSGCQQRPEDVCFIEIVDGKLGRPICKKCFTWEGQMTQNASQVIIEKTPFTVYGDIMENQEFLNEEYQKSQLSRMIESKFPQAELFARIQRYEQAITYYERWIDRDSRKDLEATALAYSNLASAYKNMGRYNDAIEFNARALEIRIAKHGEESGLVGESYNSLGLLYYCTYNYGKAMKYCVKALDIKIKISAACTDITESYNNVGNCYSSLGKYAKAAENYTEALKFSTKEFGYTHPDTLMTLSMLGNCYKKLNEFDKSLELYKKGLELRKQLFGEKHSDTATAMDDVGLILAEKGEYKEALSLLRESAFLRLEIFSDANQQLLTRMREEAHSKEKSGEIISQAVKNMLMEAKCEDPSITQSMYNIGLVYEKQGKNQEAVEWLEKALEKRKSQLGDKHLDTGMTYDILSCVNERMGKTETALKHANIALEIKRATLGDKHPETATTYTTLGSVYKSMGDYNSAVNYFLKALAIEQTTIGDNHSETANKYTNIGSALIKLEKYEKARAYLLQAYEIKKSSDTHPDFVPICDGIGICHLWKGEYQKALGNFLEAEKITKLFLEMKDSGASHRYKNISECFGGVADVRNSVDYFCRAFELTNQAHPKKSSFRNAIICNESGDNQTSIKVDVKK